MSGSLVPMHYALIALSPKSEYNILPVRGCPATKLWVARLSRLGEVPITFSPFPRQSKTFQAYFILLYLYYYNLSVLVSLCRNFQPAEFSRFDSPKSIATTNQSTWKRYSPCPSTTSPPMTNPRSAKAYAKSKVSSLRYASRPLLQNLLLSAVAL